MWRQRKAFFFKKFLNKWGGCILSLIYFWMLIDFCIQSNNVQLEEVTCLKYCWLQMIKGKLKNKANLSHYFLIKKKWVISKFRTFLKAAFSVTMATASIEHVKKTYRHNFKTKQQARLYYCLKQDAYQLLRSPNDGWTSDKPRDCRKLKSIVNEIIKSFLRIRHDSSEIRRRLLRNSFIWDSEMKDFHYSTYFLCSYIHLYYFFFFLLCPMSCLS